MTRHDPKLGGVPSTIRHVHRSKTIDGADVDLFTASALESDRITICQEHRMRLVHLTQLGSVLTLLVGCKESPTAPAGALLGRWGGERAELVAEVAAVRVNFGCGNVLARAPLVPDPEGRFVLAAAPERGATGVVVTLRGIVTGSQITFDAVTMTALETYTSQHTVIRDQPPDFSHVICALSDL